MLFFDSLFFDSLFLWFPVIPLFREVLMFLRLALVLMFAPAAAGASGFAAEQAEPFVRLALECAVQ